MQPIYLLTPVSTVVADSAEIQVPMELPAKVGRDAANDFSFPHDLQMSSAHFEVRVESGGCRIRDLHSTNGLFLNARRVENALAVEGDEIRAGESVWRVAVRGGHAPPRMAAMPIEQPSHSSLGSSSLGFDPRPTSPSIHPPLAPSAAESELHLTTQQGVSRKLTARQRLTVGRTSLSDWVFGHDIEMSSLHLEVFHSAGGWKVKDLQSSNGTFVNEKRIAEVQLFTGDEIRGGQTRLTVIIEHASLPPLASGTDSPQVAMHDTKEASSTGAAPFVPQPASTPPHTMQPPPSAQAFAEGATTNVARLHRLADGREYELPPHQMRQIGRGLDAPISLPDDLEVSTQHATVLFDGRRIQLRDIGSSNGTFVAGQRVILCELQNGDRFRVGQTEMEVCLPQLRDFPLRTSPAATTPIPAGNGSLAQAASPMAPVVHPTTQDTGEQLDPQQLPMWSDAQQEFQPPPANADELPYFSPEDFADWSTVGDEPQFRSDDLSAEGARGTENLEDWSVDEPLEPLETPTKTTSPATDESQSSVSASNESAVDQRPAAAIHQEATSAGAMAAPDESPSIRLTTDLPAHSGRYAAIDYQAFPCGSGLVVFRGASSKIDPVDVGVRLLQATSGWVLNGSEIEEWIGALGEGSTDKPGEPGEWLSPARADDASWMLPFATSWGSDRTWLVFARAEVQDVQKSLLNLRHPVADRKALVPSLTPAALADFLANRGSTSVQRFFTPLDAILLEIHAGERWAIFGRKDLESSLNELGFVHRRQW